MFKTGTPLFFSVSRSINDISARDWDSLFKADLIEGFGFHKAFEESAIPGFSIGYLLGRRAGKLAAVIPFFTTDFSFSTLTQGRVKNWILKLQKRFPRFLRIKLLFIGSPIAEELYIGIDKDEDFAEVIAQALREIYKFALMSRINTVLFYNLPEGQDRLAQLLSRHGFCRMEDFPNTRVDLGMAHSAAEYIRSLSRNARKDTLRKLRKTAALERPLRSVVTDEPGPALARIYELYSHNLDDSDVQFETLTPAFFLNICRAMPGVAKFFLTYDGGKLVAFNLCFVKGSVCIDKFIGFDREVSHKYHLYTFTFYNNIEWCLKNGVRYYQMGITDYHPKLRLGAKLAPLAVYFRRLDPFTNFFAQPIARLLQPKNFDPVLKKLKAKTQIS
ncbi:MAG: hypothetical protein A3G38_00315 [Omnitrophica WOR_2 bacterium RIFCSPLOWO2_12_FULL_51_8]|nr:MAG: hypothetical protein A3G38_00315 [Omnitrophica WOR_2 bacterium RIFCSPLOWO2_12_FULL_51_8]